MSEHTKEPWSQNESLVNGYEIWAGGIMLASTGHAKFDYENTRRIVACVNACEGISTGALELMVSEGDSLNEMFKREAAESQTERDELLAALKQLRANCDTGERDEGERDEDGKQRGVKMPPKWVVDEAESVIAKADGGK